MGLFDNLFGKKDENSSASPDAQIKQQLEAAGINTSNITVAMNGASIVLNGTVSSEAENTKLQSLVKTFGQYLKVENNVTSTAPSTTTTNNNTTTTNNNNTINNDNDYIEYVVKKGDTPWGIAEQFYGDGNKYKLLEEYNGFTGHIFADQVLRIPSVRAHIGSKKLQLILNTVGYNVGNIDGVIGANTKAALKRFQQDNNLAATGEVDSNTSNALRNAFRNQAQTLTPIALQLILNESGFNAGTVDGVLGQKTIGALRDFQTKFGLNATGSLDADTTAALIKNYV